MFEVNVKNVTEQEEQEEEEQDQLGFGVLDNQSLIHVKFSIHLFYPCPLR